MKPNFTSVGLLRSVNPSLVKSTLKATSVSCIKSSSSSKASIPIPVLQRASPAGVNDIPTFCGSLKKKVPQGSHLSLSLLNLTSTLSVSSCSAKE